MKSRLLLSPETYQGHAILAHLKRLGAADAVSLGDAGDGAVVARGGAALSTFAEIIPTTSRCTEAALRQLGGVQVGDIAMPAEALRWFDKPWSLSTARAEGVATPDTWLDATEIPANAGPIFFKPNREGTGGARGWVDTKADLPAAIAAPGAQFLFQERIPGPDVFSLAFLADRGRILASAGLWERLSYPLAGGSAVVMALRDDPALNAKTGALLEASNYSGWGLAEFKRCPRRNDYVFMEINPKFWASLELVLRTTPNFSKLLFGHDAPAERIEAMWWPTRFFRLGLDAWPGRLRALTGARAATHPLDVKVALAALTPYGLRRVLGRRLRGE